MSCALTQGYVQDCLENFGGTTETWVIEFPNITVTEVAGVITVITKVATKFFRKYDIEAHTGEADNEMSVKRESATRSNKQTVKFPINGMSVSFRNECELLAQNRVVFVIKDENGIYWMYGSEYGLRLSTLSAKTGKALSDQNGYMFTFEGEEKHLPRKVDPTVAAALATPGA